MRSFQIYQLLDGASPTGGFVYSSGIEALWHLKMMTCSEDFRSFLDMAGHHYASSELPYFRSAMLNCRNEVMLREIDTYYTATLTSPTIQRSSRQQALSWRKFLENIWDEETSTGISFPKGCYVPSNFTPFLGYALAYLKLNQEESVHLYLYITLRDLVSAAVRLGLIGSTEGVKILSYYFHHWVLISSSYLNLEWSDAYRQAPMLDFCQSIHGDLFGKMFQS